MEYPTLNKNEAKNGILDKYKIPHLKGKFITQSDDVRSYTVFDSLDDFIDNFSACGTPMFHELILANSPQNSSLILITKRKCIISIPISAKWTITTASLIGVAL